VTVHVTSEAPSARQDGFGTRTVEQVAGLGYVERLVLCPALATAASEQAIRARAAHLTGITGGPLAGVLRVERGAAGLSVLSPALDGVPASELLAASEFGAVSLTGDELLVLLASVVRAAGALHAALGTLSHGALAPEHVVVMRDGTIRITCGVFGDAIQALQYNRERLWHEFGLALPASARSPRFDRRGDVVQLGMLVLALVEGRAVRADEFPRGYEELARAVTIDAPGADVVGLRRWLEGALHLGGRVVFDSAVAAARAFERLLPPAGGDPAMALALRMVIGQQLSSSPDPAPGEAPASRCGQSTSVEGFELLPCGDVALREETASPFLDGSIHLRSGRGHRTGGVRG
jgi:hypothetical protein